MITETIREIINNFNNLYFFSVKHKVKQDERRRVFRIFYLESCPVVELQEFCFGKINNLTKLQLHSKWNNFNPKTQNAII